MGRWYWRHGCDVRAPQPNICTGEQSEDNPRPVNPSAWPRIVLLWPYAHVVVLYGVREKRDAAQAENSLLTTCPCTSVNR